MSSKKLNTSFVKSVPIRENQADDELTNNSQQNTESFEQIRARLQRTNKIRDEIEKVVAAPLSTIGEGLVKEMFTDSNGRSVALVPLDMLSPAPDDWNFFPLPDKETCMTMVDSFLANGQKKELIVWQQEENKYMILGGHTRFKVCKFICTVEPSLIAKLGRLRCIVFKKDELTEEEAKYKIIEDNLEQRAKESVPLMVKSIVESMNLAKKIKKENWGNSLIKVSKEAVAEKMGVSERTIGTYYALRNLIPGFFDMLANDELALKDAAKLCLLTSPVQEYLLKESCYKAIPELKYNRLKKAETESAANAIMSEKDTYKFGGCILSQPVPDAFKKVSLAVDKQDEAIMKAGFLKALETMNFKNETSKAILKELLAE